jgi:tetratricopeptide (TPR) repeat protein
MRFSLAILLLVTPLLGARNAHSEDVKGVRSYEGAVTVPTYEHSGRETEPPLFASSTVLGMYPFTTYLMPYKPGPEPKTYHAIFVENEYLKLTYIPEFGDRIFSVYDKLRGREMLYRNDVIKPAPYNPRNSWPQSGMELTGPHDLHTLTLHGEPYWANKVVPHADGSISLILSEFDPVYGMEVNLSATLHPGMAALQIGVYCYNTQDGRKPQMFWINTAINATPKLRFIYPMSRTVGHTTADIADWPLYNGIDYSLDRNNKHMLGVFGIDIYDNFQGAYQFDRDYGIFRYADRRIVQGMKLWTFGYGEGSKTFENGYTDNAGPYVELQSGRHVWDGHYEWVAPHKVESWNEWWVPISQTGGLTTMTQDVALNLDLHAGDLTLVLAATRVIRGGHLSVRSKSGDILTKRIDLDPVKPLRIETASADADGHKLADLTVTVNDAAGKSLLEYHRPDSDPGKQEYTPFTRPLEKPKKSVDEMSVEELTIAAEFRLKELDEAGAQALLDKALARDPGNSRVHLLMGMTDFNAGRYASATTNLEKAVERDPYADAAYYYLSMSQLALGEDAKAERNLYFIWPDSSFYGEREYHLGRLALLRKNFETAIEHFRRAVSADGNDLLARVALALTLRASGDRAAAAQELASVQTADPINRYAQAERWLLTQKSTDRAELLRLLGGQTQEAMALATLYQSLRQWADAARILQLAEETKHDLWGTTPEFYYTLAYCQRRAGDAPRADASLTKARSSAGNVDRFPYRAESEAPLQEAVRLDPADVTARFDLACLLYYRGRQKEAIAQWEAAVSAKPNDFSSRRALGLAYAEQGMPVEKAAGQLEQAVELRPAHIRTLDDLSMLYARAGQFDKQLTVLNKALQASPLDDDLAEGVFAADLNMGRYEQAEDLIKTHVFAPRHRTYTLRDKFRLMRCGEGAEAFQRGEYQQALKLFESALTPPVSLGSDDFASPATPRLDYYMGRTLDALGESAKAQQLYEKATAGQEQLSGDRDSWNSENFFMILSLDRLGRAVEASRLEKHFQGFAETERESINAARRAEARYLLALIGKREGHPEQAKQLLGQALDAMPNLLAARLDLRGDVVDFTPAAH